MPPDCTPTLTVGEISSGHLSPNSWQADYSVCIKHLIKMCVSRTAVIRSTGAPEKAWRDYPKTVNQREKKKKPFLTRILDEVPCSSFNTTLLTNLLRPGLLCLQTISEISLSLPHLLRQPINMCCYGKRTSSKFSITQTLKATPS